MEKTFIDPYTGEEFYPLTSKEKFFIGGVFAVCASLWILAGLLIIN